MNKKDKPKSGVFITENKKSEEKAPTKPSRLQALKNFTSRIVSISERTLGDLSSSGTREVDYYYNGAADFTRDEIYEAIMSRDYELQRQISESSYYANGTYAQWILHYATILLYRGMLIPHSVTDDFSKASITRYEKAVEAVENMQIPTLGKHIAFNVLLYGRYCGVVGRDMDNKLTIRDLPIDHCRVRKKTSKGLLLIEFDLTYFEKNGVELLDGYPAFLADAYYEMVVGNPYRNENEPVWYEIPAHLGAAFQLFTPKPFFLSALPAIVEFDDSLDRKGRREEKAISQIITQHIPHLNDGELLFEPDEAEEMHIGLVNMIQGMEDTSVITSYGDVELLSNRDSTSESKADTKEMRQNMYSSAGASQELFSATTSGSLKVSLENDTSIMFTLAESIATFIEEIINNEYSTKSLYFTYKIFPVTAYNQKDWVDITMKGATSGYSFIAPAIVMGMTQSELVNTKRLENDVLNLKDLLVPLSTSYTQSGKETEKTGRPEKDDEDKSDKTVTNIDAGGKNVE